MAASDLLYFGLTTLRGKQTLGEEYCNIRPSCRRDKGRFPSLGRRTLFCALTIIGPYLVNKLVKQNEQRLAQLAFEQSQALQPSDEDYSPNLKQMLKAALLSELLPESLQGLIKNFEHFHLALFFIWKRYYQLTRRLSKITYVKHKPDNQSLIHDYLKPGRIIMAQILFSLGVLLIRITKTLLKTYRAFKRRKALLRDRELEGYYFQD